MNNPTGLLNRLIRPAAAWALPGVIAAWALAAGGVPPGDQFAKARKVARGDTPVMQMPGSLASEPQPWRSDTVLPNSQHWFLPTARPGHESPNAKAPKLKALNIRPTTLAAEYAMETHGVQPFPDLPPTSPLAWADFPDPSELSVPITLSDPDAGGAKLSNDPTSGQSRLTVLAVHPPLRQAPAAFLRLVIPDPFALVEAVRLGPQAMPPDNDPPSLPETPPDPTMPVTPRN